MKTNSEVIASVSQSTLRNKGATFGGTKGAGADTVLGAGVRDAPGFFPTTAFALSMLLKSIQLARRKRANTRSVPVAVCPLKSEGGEIIMFLFVQPRKIGDLVTSQPISQQPATIRRVGQAAVLA